MGSPCIFLNFSRIPKCFPRFLYGYLGERTKFHELFSWEAALGAFRPCPNRMVNEFLTLIGQRLWSAWYPFGPNSKGKLWRVNAYLKSLKSIVLCLWIQ